MSLKKKTPNSPYVDLIIDDLKSLTASMKQLSKHINKLNHPVKPQKKDKHHGK